MLFLINKLKIQKSEFDLTAFFSYSLIIVSKSCAIKLILSLLVYFPLSKLFKSFSYKSESNSLFCFLISYLLWERICWMLIEIILSAASRSLISFYGWLRILIFLLTSLLIYSSYWLSSFYIYFSFFGWEVFHSWMSDSHFLSIYSDKYLEAAKSIISIKFYSIC